MKVTQEGPNVAQDGGDEVPRAPKEGPRRPQGGPKEAPRRPRKAQMRPQGRPKMAPRCPKKGPSEAKRPTAKTYQNHRETLVFEGFQALWGEEIEAKMG